MNQIENIRESLNKKRLKLSSTRVSPLHSTQVEDAKQLLTLVQSCTNDKKNKISLIKLINYLKKQDYKQINYESLNQQQAFFLMKSVSSWISQSIMEFNKQMNISEQITFLTEFYEFLIKVFNIQFNSNFMKLAYVYYLNNLSLVFLKSKQYKNAISYLLEASKIYEKIMINDPVFAIIFNNIALIYFLLDDYEKSEKYIKIGIQIGKDIHRQYLANKYSKESEYIQNINLLAHLYIMYLKIADKKKQKSNNNLEIEKAVYSLLKMNEVKLSKKNWFVKYYMQRKKRNNRYDNQINTPFQTIFIININQLHLYCQNPIKTQKKKQRSTKKLTLNSISNDFQEAYGQETSKNRFQREINQKQSKQYLLKIGNIQKSQQLILSRLRKITVESQHKVQRIEFTERTIRQPKIVFKTSIYNIAFFDQGIIINDFTEIQQKISWDILFNVLTRLQTYQFYAIQVQQIKNEYFLSKLLSHHIKFISNKIKILKDPIPLFQIENCLNYNYDFHFLQNRSFKVIATNSQTNKKFIINVEFDEKVFDHYFKIIKTDQYKEKLKQKFSSKEKNYNKKQFSLEVIKLKTQTTQYFQIDLIKDLSNILKKLAKLLGTDRISSNFAKILFTFDQDSHQTSLLASYYLIIENKKQKIFQLFLFPLNEFSGVNENFYINQAFPFQQIARQFGFKSKNFSNMQTLLIRHYLCDLNQLIINHLVINNQDSYILHMENKTSQVGAFIQKFFFNKYYRPVTITLLGMQKKCYGISIAFYNQNSIDQQNYFIVCNVEWYDMTREEIHNYLKKDTQILKENLLCKLIRLIDCKKIYAILNKFSTQTGNYIIYLQKFLELIKV